MASHRVDLLRVPASTTPGPKTQPLRRARLTVEAGDVLRADARLSRRGASGDGRATFVLAVDGEEVARLPLEVTKAHDADVATLDLEPWLGRDVEIEARIEGAGDGWHAYWQSLAAERVQTVERRTSEAGRNVLLVMVDTLRADHLGLYGATRDTSPRLDAFASRARVFDHALAPSSWTLPSVAALFTGLYPRDRGWADGQALELHHLLLPQRLQRAGLSTFASSANPLIAPSHGFDRGFEVFQHRPWELAPRLHDDFFAWLDRHRETQWFAYLHAIDPHDPYTDSPEPFASRFVRDPDYDGVFADPGALNRIHLESAWGDRDAVDVEAADLDWLIDKYDGEIAFWDHHFGRLIDGLEARGLLERTIVIVMSDHGEEFLEHGFLKHGRSLYRPALHVPLLIFAPGLVEPGRVDAVAETIRLDRAILQLLRLDEGPSRPNDLLRLEDGDRFPAFATTRVPHGPGISRRYSLDAVREDALKLVHRPDDDGLEAWTELYDLNVDPGEQTSLAEARPEQAEALQQLLDTWARSSGPRSSDAERGELQPEELEALRALGYVQ
ncbi:MAG: sulfatase-like hydrolase/transferase [Acidobacteriota bacterium]